MLENNKNENIEKLPTLDELLTIGNKLIYNGQEVTIVEDGPDYIKFVDNNGNGVGIWLPKLNKGNQRESSIRDQYDFLRYQNKKV